MPKTLNLNRTNAYASVGHITSGFGNVQHTVMDGFLNVIKILSYGKIT